jgi:hypothetical protein
MKTRGKRLVQALAMAVMFFSLAMSFTAYAAPATTQKSPQQVQPVGSASPASVKYDPNAPPQGTITIPASTKGNVNASTWVIGTYQYIQWTMSGTYTKLADVTLWYNNGKFADIGKGISTGQTVYTVPLHMSMGNYELRITSQDDPRVETRKAITVELPKITITAPKGNEVLYLGDKYTIIWSYTGNPGNLYFYLRADQGKLFQRIGLPVVVSGVGLGDTSSPSFPAGQLSSVNTGMGGGSVVWTLPDQPPDNISHLFYLEAHGADNYYITASSPKFQLACKHSYCNGYCANLLTDVRSCGWCGHRCSDDGYGMICDQGKCKCPPNITTCQGQRTYCSDLTNSVDNCGSCGNDCKKIMGPGSSCKNSSCGCFAPNAICGTQCADLQSDRNNCGKCGNTCTGNQMCSLGVCKVVLNPFKQPPVGSTCPGGLTPYNINGNVVCM